MILCIKRSINNHICIKKITKYFTQLEALYERRECMLDFR